LVVQESEAPPRDDVFDDPLLLVGREGGFRADVRTLGLR
jgi:hypothetical protein